MTLSSPWRSIGPFRPVHDVRMVRYLTNRSARNSTTANARIVVER
jgi:hypothetical protein